ncbi:MAG: hypothetical protein ACE141_12965 [Bryobacteraceae bacterium]
MSVGDFSIAATRQARVMLQESGIAMELLLRRLRQPARGGNQSVG